MNLLAWLKSRLGKKPKGYNFNLILVKSDEQPSWEARDGGIVVTTMCQAVTSSNKSKKNGKPNNKHNSKSNSNVNTVTLAFPDVLVHAEEQFHKTSYRPNLKDLYGDGKNIWVLRVTTNDNDMPWGCTLIYDDSKHSSRFYKNLKTFKGIVNAGAGSDIATSYNPVELTEGTYDGANVTTETASQDAEDNKVDISDEKQFGEPQVETEEQSLVAVEIDENQLQVEDSPQEQNEKPNEKEQSCDTINDLEKISVTYKEAIIEELTKFGINKDNIYMDHSVNQLLSILSEKICELRQQAAKNAENLAKQQETAKRRQQELEKNAKELTEERLDWQKKLDEANSKYDEFVMKSNSSKAELQAQVDELKEKVAGLKNDKENLIEEKDVLAKEKEILVKDNEELRGSDVGKLRDEVSKLKDKKEDLSNEKLKLTSKLDNVKKEIANCNTQIATLESDNSILTKQLKDKISECNQQEKTLKRANKDAADKQQQIDKLTAEKNQIVDNLNDANSHLMEVRQNLTVANDQIKELEEMVSRKKDEIAGQNDKIASLQATNTELASAMASDVKQLSALFNDAAIALVDAVKDDFICECNVDAETDTVQSMCRKIRNGVNDVATKIQAFNNPTATTIELQADYEALIAASIELPAFTDLARWWAYSRLAFVANVNRDEGRTASIKAMDVAYSALARMLALAGYRYQIPALFVENLNEGDYDNVTGKAQLNLDYQYPNVRSHVGAIDRDDRSNTIIDIVELGYYKNSKLVKKTSVIV